MPAATSPADDNASPDTNVSETPLAQSDSSALDMPATTPSGNNASHDSKLSEAPLAQSDSSVLDTSFIAPPQGVTASLASPFVDSNVSDNFGDASGGTGDLFN
jgi:hypothetical protein